MSNIFPTTFTRVAYKKLNNPQVRKLRDNEMEVLNKAKTTDFKYNTFNIKVYEWGQEGEEIFLIHGWEGQAGNFSDLIEKLVENGFKVIAFDAPSHGFSTKAETNLLEFSELIALLIKQYQVKKLVSHSFGGVATTYALYNNPEIEIEKYVLLTTPDTFKERIDDVVKQYGISEKVKIKLIEKLERENNFNVESLSVSNFVKEIRVNKSLIIHDKNDGVIPIRQSKNVHDNWEQSEFQEVQGTGHFRILRTDKILNKVIDFIR